MRGGKSTSHYTSHMWKIRYQQYYQRGLARGLGLSDSKQTYSIPYWLSFNPLKFLLPLLQLPQYLLLGLGQCLRNLGRQGPNTVANQLVCTHMGLGIRQQQRYKPGLGGRASAYHLTLINNVLVTEWDMSLSTSNECTLIVSGLKSLKTASCATKRLTCSSHYRMTIFTYTGLKMMGCKKCQVESLVTSIISMFIVIMILQVQIPHRLRISQPEG